MPSGGGSPMSEKNPGSSASTASAFNPNPIVGLRHRFLTACTEFPPKSPAGRDLNTRHSSCNRVRAVGVALVTGAAGGIGRGIVARLSEDGHDVVGVDVDDCDVSD